MQVPGSAQIGIIFPIGGHVARSRAFAEIDNRWIAFSYAALQLEASRIPLIEENTHRIQTDLLHLMQDISSEGVSSEPTYPAKDRKSTRLNSSHVSISYAVFCLKKK